MSRPRYHHPQFPMIRQNILNSYVHVLKAEGKEGVELTDAFIEDMEEILSVSRDSFTRQRAPKRKESA